jgi:hypothetical protein
MRVENGTAIVKLHSAVLHNVKHGVGMSNSISTHMAKRIETCSYRKAFILEHS